MLSSVSLVTEIQCVKAACLKSLSKLNLNNKRTKDSVITSKSFTQIFILDCRTVLRHIQNSFWLLFRLLWQALLISVSFVYT